MPDHGRELAFGVAVTPLADEVALARALATRADALRLDLVGIQDHPYQRRFVETWSLMADLLARTERVGVFPDVANLPLRLPAMIAKQAASLDVLSSGRFELGLGGGAFWEAIQAMGGPQRSARETLEALAEAIQIIRRFWAGERGLRYDGAHYQVAGVQPGPSPAHEIGIWLGVLKPRALELTGRVADGWVPSSSYAPPPLIPEMQRRIDDAAEQSGRRPSDIRRIYNVMGTIVDRPTRALLDGGANHWADVLTEFALDLGFDTFIFWPAGDDELPQLERFAQEVVPAVRERVGAARARLER